ncbi:MAG: SBBP repeat-containing protein [Acidobacteria bacterium]|nr:SBBP repeat-containing protein [Acidobacteriota bacterium]
MIRFFVFAFIAASSLFADDLFTPLTLHRIAGSGTDTIDAVASDAAGNIIIAGATTSPDLPVRNAFQSTLGESQIMRTTDGGKSWQKLALLPASAVATIEPHPANPSILLAGTADGVFKSTDAGNSWKSTFAFSPSPVPVAGRSVFRIAFDPAQTAYVYALTSEGTIRSGDGGDTWARVESGIGGVSSFTPILTVDPLGSGTVAIGSVFGVLLSKDHGITWTPLRIPPPGFSPSVFAFDPRQAGRLYYGAGPGTIGSFYTSDDNGNNWIQRAAPGNSLVTGLAFSEKPEAIFALTLGGLYRSDDKAVTWTTVTPNASFYYGTRIAVLPSTCPSSLLASAGSRILLSTDAGRTWTSGPFSDVTDLSAGSGCSLYAARRLSGDAYMAKLTPNGEVHWLTYLGGGGREITSAVTTDPAGNIYLNGITDSPDFPGGSSNQYATFLTKIDAEGAMIYSRIIHSTNPVRFAADAQGNAYVLTVPRFDGPNPPPASYAVTKFSPSGDVQYQTPLTDQPLAVTANSQGLATITTSSAILHLDAAGQLLGRDESSPYRNATFLITDAEDNIYFVGASTDPAFPVTILAEGRSHTCPTYSTTSSVRPGDTYIAKQSLSGEILFSTLLAGECASAPASMAMGPSGAVVSLSTQSNGFPLRYPLATAGLSGAGSHSVIVSLTNDGTIDFASYTNATTGGPVTVTADGIHPAISTSLVRLPAPATNTVALHAVNNAFSQASNGIAAGSLVALTGVNLGPDEPVDLGFDTKATLPTELSGTQVLFDGEPAQLLRASANLIVAVAPRSLRDAITTQVEVVRGGERSNSVTTRVRSNVPQLLASDFPEVNRYAAAPDGAVLNSDGTPNSATNPAAIGTTVTLVLTGAPDNILYTSFDNYTVPVAAQPIPGLIDSVRQLAVKLPATAATNRLTVSISPNPTARFFSPILASRPVTVYVE